MGGGQNGKACETLVFRGERFILQAMPEESKTRGPSDGESIMDAGEAEPQSGPTSSTAPPADEPAAAEASDAMTGAQAEAARL